MTDLRRSSRRTPHHVARLSHDGHHYMVRFTLDNRSKAALQFGKWGNSATFNLTPQKAALAANAVMMADWDGK